ncbi:beta-glucuronosyltransferase GlcAT14A [Trifolium repens]|nr:beta-glucuronosyltransferase GlcAT14A [Trifolium repens]
MFFFFFTFIFSHNNLIQRPKTNLIQFPTHLSPLSHFFFFFFFFTFFNPYRPDPFLYLTHQTHRIIYDQDKTTPPPPSIAYLISGSKGDSSRILRLLYATYHPLNHYLLHLDPSAPHSDRANLALVVQSNPIFKAAQNVYVMRKPDS